MVINYRDGKTINVNLEDGVYLIDGKGADGKTFMCKILKSAQDVGYRVCVLTYESMYRTKHYIEFIRACSGYDLIFLDRFDLYQNISIIEEAKKNAKVVLIDWKSALYRGDFSLFDDTAFIDFDDKGFTVE